MKIAYMFFNGKLLGNKMFYKNFIKNHKGDIYCADGGANITYSLGLNPLEIWGDLDSIQEDILKYYKEKSILIKKFPREKDNTDSELLLDYLLDKKYDKIYCIAGLGGDIDHELSNINLCFKYENLHFLDENQELFKVYNNFSFENINGKKISFIIFSDEVKNLKLNGFKYNVNTLNIKRGESRCISNIVIENNAKISFDSGLLLAVIKN